MLTFIKLGGSLITDKQVESCFHEETMMRLANEIRAALDKNDELSLLIGHGSGSFGHFAAKRYGTINGVQSPSDWRGFAEVAGAAGELNYHVTKILQKAGVPVWSLQPSASVLSKDGSIVEMALRPIRQAIAHGLVPLIYGDVALDESLGGTIVSTETIFFYLAQLLPVTCILLLGEVEGVYDRDHNLIPKITPANFAQIEHALGASAGVDVTGGMIAKVQDMLALVSDYSSLTIRIFDGRKSGLLTETLLNKTNPGTLIIAEDEKAN